MRYLFVFIITLLLLFCFDLVELDDFELTAAPPKYMRLSISAELELLLYRDDKLALSEAFIDVGADAAVANGTLFLYSPSIALNSSISLFSRA
jgi:hypothetical protein